MADARLVLLLDSSAVPVVPNTAEGRWAAWQRRSDARDALTRRRLLVLAAFGALALASMLTGIALGGS